MRKNYKIMNAENNPFRSEEIEKIKFIFDDYSMNRLFSDLEKYDYAASITGDHGRGKTQLLEEIIRKLKSEEIKFRKIFLNEEIKTDLTVLINILKYDGLIIIDGAEQIPCFYWKILLHFIKLLKKKIIITSHENLGLPVLYHCRTSPRLLKEIQEKLCPEMKIDNEKYFEKNNGNIREILREYYDIRAGIY